jgi:uncharacterized membrane protein YoaK (UPF0700 family)
MLAAVAGFVDACTYLGLFGFFVAQVTGSYVLAGARPGRLAWSGGAARGACILRPRRRRMLAAIAGRAIARRAPAGAFALETTC